MKKPQIIAEVGCNHKGEMDIARELILTAALYGKADVVKFQKRCNRELLPPSRSAAWKASHSAKPPTLVMT